MHERINNSDMNEENKDNVNIFNRISSSTQESRSFYFPLAICLWSQISNTDFFKNILIELHKVLNLPNKQLDKLSVGVEEIRDYQFCELMNYFHFLSNLIKPSPYTTMTINFRKYIF